MNNTVCLTAIGDGSSIGIAEEALRRSQVLALWEMHAGSRLVLLQLEGTDKVLTRKDLHDPHRRELKLHKGAGGWFAI